MASEKKLQELFHETLKDIYFAEKKILSALPKMAKAAHSARAQIRVSEDTRPKPKSTLPGSRKYSRKSMRPRAEKLATPSWASSRKGRR